MRGAAGLGGRARGRGSPSEVRVRLGWGVVPWSRDRAGEAPGDPEGAARGEVERAGGGVRCTMPWGLSSSRDP